MDPKKTNFDTWREEYIGEANAEKLKAIETAAATFGEDEIVPLDMTKPAGELAIFRTPTSAEHARFTASILGEKGDIRARAAEVLARNCVVHPDKQTFAKWCDRYPAIGGGVLKSLLALAGGGATQRGKE